MAQPWTFEAPVNVSASSPVNLTWNPRTLNSGNYGNFLLNLWLLRKDAQGATLVKEHLPYLLASDHYVYNYTVLWTPTLDDIDANVPEAGSHQLAWEQSQSNPDHNPSNTSFKGWSRGFHINAPISLSSSSIPSITSTSSAPSSTSISPSTAQESSSSPTKTSTPTIIGLVIGLVLLLLISICAALWGVRKYRQVQRRNALSTELPMPMDYSIVPNSKVYYNSSQNSMSDPMPEVRGERYGYSRRDVKPAELSATVNVAEL
ncbi:hypothetical protein SBOR_4890 [Sclerotinia borealis F-4128]|uniref:Mid2 domain-containing protein n=1 Tax=Sclerotinia borealis (strain F-4128) TaxID=1432307 RepID=W9CFN6_SCLBF|nr:hypothetical protein SBOR_4890 [Sclerotinia borealis F-4128]